MVNKQRCQGLKQLNMNLFFLKMKDTMTVILHTIT